MKEILDENFAKSLLGYALKLTRGKGDPWDLVNGACEYLLKNKEKYMNHPNIKAIAISKMKNLHIDEFRKNKRFTSMTDKEGRDIEIEDEKQTDILDQLDLSFKSRKTLSTINTMGEKCREILIYYHFDELTYDEIAEKISIPIGTVMSRLANCKIELRGLMA